jgi:hypothetical protein
MKTVPSPVAFRVYAEWLTQQPVLRAALDTMSDVDAVPASAGPHVDAVVELAAAREAGQGEWGSDLGAA